MLRREGTNHNVPSRAGDVVVEVSPASSTESLSSGGDDFAGVVVDLDSTPAQESHAGAGVVTRTAPVLRKQFAYPTNTPNGDESAETHGDRAPADESLSFVELEVPPDKAKPPSKDLTTSKRAEHHAYGHGEKRDPVLRTPAAPVHKSPPRRSSAATKKNHIHPPRNEEGQQLHKSDKKSASATRRPPIKNSPKKVRKKHSVTLTETTSGDGNDDGEGDRPEREKTDDESRGGSSGDRPEREKTDDESRGGSAGDRPEREKTNHRSGSSTDEIETDFVTKDRPEKEGVRPSEERVPEKDHKGGVPPPEEERSRHIRSPDSMPGLFPGVNGAALPPNLLAGERSPPLVPFISPGMGILPMISSSQSSSSLLETQQQRGAAPRRRNHGSQHATSPLPAAREPRSAPAESLLDTTARHWPAVHAGRWRTGDQWRAVVDGPGFSSAAQNRELAAPKEEEAKPAPKGPAEKAEAKGMAKAAAQPEAKAPDWEKFKMKRVDPLSGAADIPLPKDFAKSWAKFKGQVKKWQTQVKSIGEQDPPYLDFGTQVLSAMRGARRAVAFWMASDFKNLEEAQKAAGTGE